MTCRSIYHVYYISLQSLITRTYILIWKARGIKQSSSFFFLKSFCIGLVVRPLPVLVSNKEVPSYCVECCAAAAPISLLCAIRRSLEVLYNI